MRRIRALSTGLLLVVLFSTGSIVFANNGALPIRASLEMCLDQELSFADRVQNIQVFGWEEPAYQVDVNLYWSLQHDVSFRGGVLVYQDQHFRGLIKHADEALAIEVVQFDLNESRVLTCQISSTHSVPYSLIEHSFDGRPIKGIAFQGMEWPNASLTRKTVKSESLPRSAVVRYETLLNLPSQRN